MARALGRPRVGKRQKPKERFVIVFERRATLPDGKLITEFMVEEDESVMRFDTREQALEVGRMAHWANAWPWFVVELVDGAEVTLGTGS